MPHRSGGPPIFLNTSFFPLNSIYPPHAFHFVAGGTPIPGNVVHHPRGSSFFTPNFTFPPFFYICSWGGVPVPLLTLFFTPLAHHPLLARVGSSTLNRTCLGALPVLKRPLSARSLLFTPHMSKKKKNIQTPPKEKALPKAPKFRLIFLPL